MSHYIFLIQITSIFILVGTATRAVGKEDDNESESEEHDVSEVARSMGSETIEMLSQAKMRYTPHQTH